MHKKYTKVNLNSISRSVSIRSSKSGGSVQQIQRHCSNLCDTETEFQSENGLLTFKAPGACLSPFFSGTPDAIMCVSFTLSTCKSNKIGWVVVSWKKKEFEVMIDFENLENVVFVCDAVKHGVESVEKIGHLQKDNENSTTQ